jgi:hypothetical protein
MGTIKGAAIMGPPATDVKENSSVATVETETAAKGNV